jgi:hypothetical protein
MGGDHFADLGLNGMIILALSFILEKYGVKVWTGFKLLRIWSCQALANTVMNLRIPLRKIY